MYRETTRTAMSAVAMTKASQRQNSRTKPSLISEPRSHLEKKRTKQAHLTAKGNLKPTSTRIKRPRQ